MDAQVSELGLVAIGRNEGERLKRCLRSASPATAKVYVDSGSTDGSADWARSIGVEVVLLEPDRGFTAARARNTGFKRLTEVSPSMKYVQFIDGDCELDDAWLGAARAFLDTNADVCAVFGRRLERHPSRSIYNRLCDDEWNVPAGDARSFGGDVMLRVTALKAVGGYRDDLIAGEEPELCVRLRANGWAIRCLDHRMTLHDAGMTRFSQWWRRSVRGGYAFGLGCLIHGAGPDRLWVWESRRALFWGMGLPMIAILLCAAIGPFGLVTLLLYPVQLVRRMRGRSGNFSYRLKAAFFELLIKFPESVGLLKLGFHKMLGQRSQLIEYK